MLYNTNIVTSCTINSKAKKKIKQIFGIIYITLSF